MAITFDVGIIGRWNILEL